MTEINKTPAKKVTAVAPMNVYQKLIKARKMFLENGCAKSGKNMAIQFKYFELEDIVPAVTRIFDELGLISIVNFGKEVINDTPYDIAIMRIVNTDNPDDTVCFSSPMRFAETNKGVNPLQALGSTHTYMRRYLYLTAMDIVEADGVDCDAVTVQTEEKPVKAETREDVKTELTSGDKPADEMQIKAVKKALSTLRKLDPEQDDFVQNVGLKTERLTKLTSAQAEELIEKVGQMIAGYKTGDKNDG